MLCATNEIQGVYFFHYLSFYHSPEFSNLRISKPGLDPKGKQHRFHQRLHHCFVGSEICQEVLGYNALFLLAGTDQRYQPLLIHQKTKLYI